MQRHQDDLIINLQDLRTRLRNEGRAAEAARIMSDVRKKAKAPDLAVLLRQHETSPVTDPLEIVQRDSFDFLIAFYSIMEIASLIGYVPDPVSIADREEFLFDLEHPAVRMYYEQHYALLLPKLYRSRLESSISRGAAYGSAAIAVESRVPTRDHKQLSLLQGLFQSFLALENRARADEDIEMFLWFLDDGFALASSKNQGGETSSQTYGLQDVIACLRKRDLFVRRLLRPVHEQDTLDCALRGFGKSLSFCTDFDLLLQRCEPWPLCQSALWHYYAYWFELIHDRVGAALYEAIDTMAGWQTKQTASENEVMNAYIKRIQTSVDRLLSGQYAQALRQSLHEDQLVESEDDLEDEGPTTFIGSTN